jgi:hypothetical protein
MSIIADHSHSMEPVLESISHSLDKSAIKVIQAALLLSSFIFELLSQP